MNLSEELSRRATAKLSILFGGHSQALEQLNERDEVIKRSPAEKVEAGMYRQTWRT